MAEHPVNERLRTELLNLLVEAQILGEVRPVDWYVQQFPGHEDFIRNEISTISSDDVTLAPESYPGTYERRIGRYRLLRELGRGGQGVVYLAQDEHLGRQVALKVMAFPSVAHGQLPLRVRRELEAITRLNHEGLAVVYDAFVSDHYVCIAMRYVEGEPLSRAIMRAGPGRPADLPALQDSEIADGGTIADVDPYRRVAVFLESAARALHSAHQAGVVHRDIKPHNIMVNTRGEPVILDFGLALAGDSEFEALTGTGDLPGTPYTMAPERVRGERAEDPRGDVWSLGVTLYEALTGKRPFEAPTVQALYTQILATEPISPRQLCPEISTALADVTLTALAKEPPARYATAGAFADDLARALRGEPIHARPPGPIRRSIRWAQRHPARAVALLLLITALALAVAGAMAMRDLAERRDEARRDAETALASSLYEQGRAALLAQQPGRKAAALDLFLRVAAWNRKGIPLLTTTKNAGAGPQAGRKALRDALTESWLLKDLRPVDSPLGFTAVTGVLANHAPIGAFPDLSAGMRDFSVRMTDLASGEVLQVFRDPHLPGQALRLSPEGEYLAAVTDRGRTLRMWRLATQEMVIEEPLEWKDVSEAVTGGIRPLERWYLTVAHKGCTVAAVREIPGVDGVSMRSLWAFSLHATPRLRMARHGNDVGWPCALTTDGTHLGARNGSSELGVWDLRSPHSPTRIAFDGEPVAVRFRGSDPDSFVAVWRAPGRPTDTLGLRAPGAAMALRSMNLGGRCESNSAFELSPDGSLAMTNDSSGPIRIVDLEALHVAIILDSATEGHVEGISWHGANTRITRQIRGSGTLTYAVDANVDLLRTFPMLPAGIKPDPRLAGGSMDFCPRSERLALYDPGRPTEISLWSVKDGSLQRIIETKDQRSAVVQLCWSHDGTRLARLTSSDWTIWDARDALAPPIHHTISESGVNAHAIACTPSGEFRIIASRNDALLALSTDGEVIKQYRAPPTRGMIWWSLDGETLVAAGDVNNEPAIFMGRLSEDALVRTPWQSALGDRVSFQHIPGGSEVHILARPASLAPSDQAASLEEVLEVIRAGDTDARLRVALDSRQMIHAVLDPSGQYLALAHRSGRVDIWEMDAGEPLLTWRLDEAAGTALLRFSPDGKHLVAWTQGRGIRLLHFADLLDRLASVGLYSR